MYEVIFSDRAEKELSQLDLGVRRRIIKAIEQLAENPLKKANVKKLAGSELYRLRVGDYRIVFDSHGKTKRIRIILLGHRKEVYR